MRSANHIKRLNPSLLIVSIILSFPVETCLHKSIGEKKKTLVDKYVVKKVKLIAPVVI